MSEINIKSLVSSVYPDCWSNDARLQQLFAPFRVRSLNTTNYDNKMKFWKEMISLYCDSKGSSSITIRELYQAFQLGERKAYVFSDVMKEMLNQYEAEIKFKFLEQPQQTWSGWAMNVVFKKPIMWSFNRVKQSIINSNDENIEYVIFEAVKVCKVLQVL